MNKEIIGSKAIVFIIVAIVINIAIINFVNVKQANNLDVILKVKSQHEEIFQVFHSMDMRFVESNSQKATYSRVTNSETLSFLVPEETQYIRLDLGTMPGEIELRDLKLKYGYGSIDLLRLVQQSKSINDITNITIQNNNYMKITTNGNDPYIILKIEQVDKEQLLKAFTYLNYVFKIVVILISTLIMWALFKNSNAIKILFKELNTNRFLIWNLSKSDFKTKYAGSYLGIIWAFIQPIVTVGVYWFVFQIGFKSNPVKDFPFVLWLVTGIVPWFFFSEALINATNSLVEYNYLVKKVVFKISILPIVKIISSLFVHLFFIVFTVMLFLGYGRVPTVHAIQIFYYSICIFVLVLALSYATSAIIIFFKDLGQIISILLQVGMWMTPIMWDVNMIPVQYQWILKINPMYYVVAGYRDSLINHVWLWERYNQTLYFWCIVIGVFILGAIIFKKLKPHFADVL